MLKLSFSKTASHGHWPNVLMDALDFWMGGVELSFVSVRSSLLYPASSFPPASLQ